MKFDSITLQNFRQYHGKQRLTFARDQQKNVTVIHGINGAGKTSLFTALNWCLYGEGMPDIALLDLVSKEAVHQAKAGEEIKTSVDLAFFHEGERFLIRRALRTLKGRGKAQTEFDSYSNLVVQRTKPDGQAVEVSNPLGLINSILPVNVRTYFLFDGEKIDNFAKPEARDEVREAIYMVLKLEVLERARKHLEEAAVDYRREVGRSANGKLAELVEQETALRETLKGWEARGEELKREIAAARDHMEDVSRKLRDLNAAQVLQTRRDELTLEQTERMTELDGINSRARDLSVASYLVGSQDAVARAVKVLEAKRERGEIPSSIRQQFVSDLLSRMTCICGRAVTNGSPEHTHLEKLLETSVSGALEDDVITTTGQLVGTFPREIERLQGDLFDVMKRRVELIDTLERLRGQLDDVSRQLQGSPLEQVAKLEKQRQKFQSDIEGYNLERGEINNRVEGANKQLEALKTEVERAQQQESKGKTILTKMKLAQDGADSLASIYEIFGHQMRMQIEAKTREIFKKLAWKGDHFDEVRLGDDYNLDVIDRYGTPARPDLSAGERQVLSLSFITAMSRVSEEEAPLVIDTPFGRLSSNHRNSITKHLPDLADQLTLFVTDEELRDQARKNLEPRIGAEYRLEFNPKTSYTEMEKVRDWRQSRTFCFEIFPRVNPKANVNRNCCGCG